VTAALVFFAIEHQWRRVLPAFCPGGDLSAVPGVLRLRVRTRLLVIFVMLSVVPLSMLGVLAYTRAAALPGVTLDAAPRIIENMLEFIVFIVAVGALAAVGLSLYVAGSVAGPLGQLQSAMREVERGDLETRCPVVTNDEIGAVSEGFNRMVGGLREREFLKETFGKYVSREIRDEILAGRVTLEGQAQEVTVLFADLRDFTPWVEATSPREVVRDLNAYFTEMDRRTGRLRHPRRDGRAGRARHAPPALGLERRAGAGREDSPPPRHRHPHRLGPGGQHRQRRAPRVRARRRPGQPGLADPEPHQGIRRRYPGQRGHAPAPRRAVRARRAAGGAGEGKIRRSRGLSASVKRS
jgi:HAMP domain-containing protein